MTDIFDRASELEQMQRDAAIANARNTETNQPIEIEGVLCCCDCADPLPQERAKANRPRCVSCQEQHELENELRQKGFR